jgi:hypothetical protein
VPLGTSASGFRAEVEAEQAMARREHLLAMTDQYQHHELTGPAAEAAARLSTFAGFAGQVTTDPRRIARLMVSHDPAIYPGEYVTCIYSHPRALCSRSDGPDLGACQPLRCRNAAFTPANRDALRAELARIDARLAKAPALPPYVQHTLTARRQAITALLTRAARRALMTRKINLPPEEHVRAAMAGMLADAAEGGPRPTVLALARNLGLPNATFWRHYHDIAIELRHAAQARQAVPAPDQNQRPGQARELATQNAALRRERDHLASQLEAALSHLRRLTIDNAELRRELQTALAITRIGMPDTASHR